MEVGGDLMQHLTNMTSLAEQLRELKKDISSKADELDWENAKGLLVEEYREKQKTQESENALLTKRDQSSKQHVAGGFRRGGSIGHGRYGNNNYGRQSKLQSFDSER